MMRERLLAKARDLIAARLEQAQVRRGNGVVVRNLGDRNTISVEPEFVGRSDTLARKQYRAGELVFNGSNVRVAPFVVPTYDPCDPSTFVDGAQPVLEFDPDFPFLIPTIGSTPLDASSPPTLTSVTTGAAWLKATYSWGQTTGVPPEPGEIGPAEIYYFLDSVEVVPLPLGTGGSQPPYSVQTAYIEQAESGAESYVLGLTVTTAHLLLGWWELGRRPVQFGAGGQVDFGVPLEDSTVSVNRGREISAPEPIAYINYIPALDD
jgi:hypothetical protein